MGGDPSLSITGSNINIDVLIKAGKKAIDNIDNQKIDNIFSQIKAENQENIDNMMGLTIEKEKKVQAPKPDSKSNRVDKHDPELLKNAPKPDVKIAGEDKKAAIVVDLSENRLYRYKEDGEAFEVYSIASGAKSTPTSTGLRQVSHIETYPYKTAPKSTKRYKNPKDYGPNILILNIIDPETGKSQGSNGEFIHGNRNPSSIGKYASHGCMRMDNDVIKQLAKEVKPGSYVIIQK